MGEIIEFSCSRAFVKKTPDGWATVVIENGIRTQYQFERCGWAEKFARDARLSFEDRTVELKVR